MVHCFLIHTVGPVGGPGPAGDSRPGPAGDSRPGPAGDSRLLFSRVFGPDETTGAAEEEEEEDAEDGPLSGERRRLLRGGRLLVVARQVLSAVSLTRAASGRGQAEGGAAPDDAAALQEADAGALRLRAGDPFPGERSVLWLAVRSLAFALVCLPHENLLLAEAALRRLARHCLEHLHLLGPGSEVLLKVDRIDFLLGKLLPHGQLLFLNHRFTQSLEKDISAYMAK